MSRHVQWWPVIGGAIGGALCGVGLYLGVPERLGWSRISAWVIPMGAVQGATLSALAQAVIAVCRTIGRRVIRAIASLLLAVLGGTAAFAACGAAFAALEGLDLDDCQRLAIHWGALAGAPATTALTLASLPPALWPERVSPLLTLLLLGTFMALGAYPFWSQGVLRDGGLGLDTGVVHACAFAMCHGVGVLIQGSLRGAPCGGGMQSSMTG